MNIPGWLMGGHPDDAGPFAGWDIGRTDEGFVGRNLESVTGDRPGLVRVSRLGMDADPANLVG